MLSPELRQECLDLRCIHRMSLRGIAAKTGVARSTLSVLLRDFPLTALEIATLRQGTYKGRCRLEREPSSFLYSLSKDKLTRTAKARVAEAAVLLRLALLDFRVFRSAFEGDIVDFLVNPSGSGKSLKLQVKWARQMSSGLPIVQNRCSAGRGKSRKYKEGEIDYLVGYDLYSDRAYVWSWSEIKDRREITISSNAMERWDKLLAS